MDVAATLFGWGCAILGFGLLILIHELGHLWAFKRQGLPVHAFSIGFGSPILQRSWGGTEYRLGWIPLGGYVLPVDPEAESGQEEEFPLTEHSPGTQMFVAVMGPAANLLLAAVIFFVMFTLWGEPTPQALVGRVIPGGPAAVAGLQPGDRLSRLNGATIDSWASFISQVQATDGRATSLEVERDGVVLTLPIQPRREGSRHVVGVTPSLVPAGPVPVLLAVGRAVTRTMTETVGIVSGLMRILTTSGGGELSGPVSILNQISQAAVGTGLGFLNLLALLSINLAVFNLLPVPPLDGLRILVAFLQYRRRWIPARWLVPAYTWGTLGLGLLFLFTTLRDLGAFFL